jgi:citrate lyase subunit beta/citryl-CoA lyase
MLAKAAGLPADEVFIDLEDAVAPEEKNDATRSQAVAALLEQEWSAPTRVVRINAVGTPWCLDDLVTVVEGARDALHCVMIPKVENAEQVHFVAEVLAHLEASRKISSRIGIEVQIETPRGLVEIERIAASSSRIETLIFGPGDYAAAARVPQLSVGVIDERYPGDQWHYPLARIASTARAFGLQPIDGPYARIRDRDGFRAAALRSRLLGFDGKWALHPDQLRDCNEIFAPTAAEVERARRIVEAYQEAVESDRRGAAMLDGEMIDEASRKMAEQVIRSDRATGMGQS